MTLLHATEQLTTATFVVEEAACDCELMDDADLDQLIDEASDVIAIASSGWVKGRTIRTYRPVWDGGDCWPGLQYDENDDDGIPLPNRPENISVRIDGTAIGTDEFKTVRIDDLEAKLIRIDPTTYARKSWPRTNKPYAPETDEGVFQVSWVQGVGIEEPAVNDACAELVCHLAQDWNKRRDVRRSKADTVSMGGASMTRQQAGDKIRQGQLDLRLMDRMLTMFDRSMSASVWSPELASRWQLLEVS